jgi:Na+-translocating ferredoxin:NAD+ oxidoreductase RnfG subunit
LSVKNKPWYKIAPVFLIILVIISLIVISNNLWIWRLQQAPETLQPLREVFPEAFYYLYSAETGIYTIYDESRINLGYAFYAEGMGEAIPRGEYGYKEAAPINILIGLKDQETIEGIYVVSQEETWFFWNLLVKNNYFDQFQGLKIEDAYFTDSGGKVDSVTMATLSSTSVLNIVRHAAIEKAALIN